MNDKQPPALTAGTLYLVPTPIGNREDITLRAVRTLRECDRVAAEDTRRTGQLLKHLGIQKPLLSYHKFSEARRTEELLEKLRAGQIIALVTDAGSPAISDPGETVVKAALTHGIRVEALPGPCAFVTALSASGLPASQIAFGGFVPRKTAKRIHFLETFKTLKATLVFYESPYRIAALLEAVQKVFPGHPLVLAREITKKFEEYLRGTPEEMIEEIKRKPRKGEFVVLIDNN